MKQDFVKHFNKKFGICFFFIILVSFIAIFSACGFNEFDRISSKLSTYNLKLDFDDTNKTLTGNEVVYYKNNTQDNVLNCIDFHLYPNAFSAEAVNKPVSLINQIKAYPNGTSYGWIEITSVKVDEIDKEIKICGDDNNILEIDLEGELYPDDSVTIEIDFNVKLPNINHRFGYGDNTYNFGNFYPIACIYENGAFMTKPYNSNGDPFYSEMANYEVSLTCDNDFVVATTGEKTENINGEKKQICATANVVRDFAFVLSKKFEVLSQQVDGTLVSYYYYDDNNAKENLKTSVDSLVTFKKLFGDYPYSTLNVVKTNFVHGGMEYPNLVYISDAIESEVEYTNVIVHEIAHQWWYNIVGSNAYDYPWLDEGLTEFSTCLFYENNLEYGVDTNETINNSLSSYMLFIDVYKSVYGDVDTSMNRSLDEYTSETEYVYMTYVKGILFFDSLRDYVGTTAFVNSLKYYYSQNKYDIATPDKMISAFERVCKRGMESFFDSWISGKIVLQNY